MHNEALFIQLNATPGQPVSNLIKGLRQTIYDDHQISINDMGATQASKYLQLWVENLLPIDNHATRVQPQHERQITTSTCYTN